MNAQALDISVVIPSNNSKKELLYIVNAVCTQTIKPAQIIIVDSAAERCACPTEIVVLCADHGINLAYKYSTGAMPGAARNIGLGLVNSELIGFIDVQTIPRPQWLESSLSALTRQDVFGVWGCTLFSAQSRIERLVRDSFYGVLPRRTLPGSVFRREIFNKTGNFIEWVRAGEDTEWMMRLKVHKIPIFSASSASVDYVGLIGSDMHQLSKKWLRNYSASQELPHLFHQKLLLLMVIYPLLVLIAFNWNYLIANWQMDSPLYIGHVTKLVAILPVLMYVIVRGVILPLKRGVEISNLFPARFMAIIAVCFIADLVKALAFALPKRKHDSDTTDIELTRKLNEKNRHE